MGSTVQQFEHSPLVSCCRFESLLQWLLRGTGHGWVAGSGLLLLDWYFQENKKPQDNCLLKEQLCMSPTTSLLLLWPQTWSYSSKNTLRTGPSQQRFRRAFHQHGQFYFLSHADNLCCGGMCLHSHLCLEITIAQEHERSFSHTLRTSKNFQ